MMKHDLKGNYKIDVATSWCPYFIFDGSPEDAKNSLIADGGFRLIANDGSRDAGRKKPSIYNLEKKITTPYRLHARVYSDSSVRVHMEPDLHAIAYKIVDELISTTYKRRGNWFVRVIKGGIYALKKFMKFRLAFSMHEEDSVKSGIDTGDYISGAILTKDFLQSSFSNFRVEHELRTQITYEDGQRIMKQLQKIYKVI